jgi:hypothetical protein
VVAGKINKKLIRHFVQDGPESRTEGYLLCYSSAADTLLFFSAHFAAGKLLFLSGRLHSSKSMKQIADQSHLSLKSVEVQRSRMREKPHGLPAPPN